MDGHVALTLISALVWNEDLLKSKQINVSFAHQDLLFPPSQKRILHCSIGGAGPFQMDADICTLAQCAKGSCKITAHALILVNQISLYYVTVSCAFGKMFCFFFSLGSLCIVAKKNSTNSVVVFALIRCNSQCACKMHLSNGHIFIQLLNKLFPNPRWVLTVLLKG